MLEILDFPFDSKLIHRKKNKLKRKLLTKPNLIEINFAILGGSTTSEIKDILDLFLLKNGFKANFYESDYNKFFEESVFKNNNLKNFKPQVIYIHTSNKNIYNYAKFTQSEEDVKIDIENEFNKYLKIWDSLSEYNCSIIQNNFELPIQRELGNLDFYDCRGRINFINKLNIKISEHFSASNNMYINDINYMSAKMGLDNWFDKSLWYRSKYSLSYLAMPTLCNNISSIVNGIFGKTKKCLVLDLDNTLWGGVIGDDNLNGIKLGNETPEGEAYLDFQKYIKNLKNRGVILAVSSKNNEEIAKSAFSHADSVLSLNDFSSFKSNWEPKDINILKIAKEINIGTDSIVFIDDNPSERALVNSQLPSVSVPNIGKNILNYIDHIEGNQFFELSNITSEDSLRSKFYNENIKRTKKQSEFKDYKEFLKSLEMKAEISEFKEDSLERITQLINKTNQFNFTTKRYLPSDIKLIKNSDNYISLSARLIDKFGDNGLISVIIGKVNKNSCNIEAWLMSCRVLKRDMEFEFFNKFIEKCIEKGINDVYGEYLVTPKNKMVSNLYSDLGFELINKEENGNSTWKLSINKFNKFKTSIITL